MNQWCNKESNEKEGDGIIIKNESSNKGIKWNEGEYQSIKMIKSLIR